MSRPTKSGDRGGHETSQNLDLKHPGNNLHQWITKRGAHLTVVIFKN